MTSNEQFLDGAFARLREDSAALHTPPRVEQALMAAFAKKQRRLRWQRFVSQKLAPLVAISATATVAAFMVFAPQPIAVPDAPAMQSDSLAYLAAADTPFVALAPMQQIEQEAAPRLVQADVPRMWLAGAGMPVDPAFAADSVRAEMLLSADGQPLAVRLMP